MHKSLLHICVLTLGLGQFWTSAAYADPAASSYLIARQADRQNDFEIAAEYYLDALFFDPENPVLARGAIDALMAFADFEMAAEIAEGLLGTDQADTKTYLALIADAAIERDFQRILTMLDSEDVQTNALMDSLVLGWANVGAGNMDAGYSAFDRVVQDDRYKAIGLSHLGFAKAFIGDHEGALDTFSEISVGNFQSARTIVAEAQVLAHLERRTEAARKLRETFGANPDVAELLGRIESGAQVEFDLITSAEDGMAEMFFSFADALNTEVPSLLNLYYAQMAAAIRVNDSQAILLVADIFEQFGRTSLARDAYLNVQASDPAFFSAAMGVAETLRTEGMVEEAAAHLEGVIADIGNGPYVLVTLGDINRQLKRYDEAVDAYTERLESGIKNGYQDWYVYYVRGISYERLGEWDRAEADFRKSLELQPAHPQVLNYLGYSLMERRENLDEALDMIEEAVSLRPDSGYIVDSLGWVYYRLGRFEDAVVPMELAVELLATDPIVNDHLGDVYWKVGRDYEARFQWQRALSFDPEPQEADRIRRKLDVGLDVVLQDEQTNE
ncbi:MAG: tetratricopeptide repeat protein [Paracoccaceae bacterium]|nr:tetratricopeptide repeat protein [Paracoccaceae bacterium]MDG2260181.1 tetratricopeptide repeat protein [Paracoccaceae bacterium]